MQHVWTRRDAMGKMGHNGTPMGHNTLGLRYDWRGHAGMQHVGTRWDTTGHDGTQNVGHKSGTQNLGHKIRDMLKEASAS